MKHYANPSYDRRSQTSRSSAETLVPHVVELLEPRSVVDVGCSTGRWLCAFQSAGVSDFLGLDGDSVRDDQLDIEKEKFRRTNLERAFTLDRTFDLAVSLEVAEHLPEASAPAFVASLARTAPVILFSAAVPGQGGYHHQNEQWQSWWAEHFRREGFIPLDCLRGKFWDDNRLKFWYRQNVFFYVREDRVADYPRLSEEATRWRFPVLDAVHPAMYEQKRFRPGLRQVLEGFPSAAWGAVRRKTGGG